MKNTLLFVCTLLFPLIIALSCSSGDSGNIAIALEDRLTDALDFEGGEYHEDQKPEGSSGANAPQISNIDGPDEFRLGAGFAIGLYSDFVDPGKVKKCIVWVKGARGYISVPGLMADKLMEIVGTLAADAELQGEDFVLEMALQTESGITGLYKPLDFKVSDQAAQNVEEPVDMVSFSGGVPKSGVRPEGSDSEDAPQIQEVDAPTELKPGQNFDVRLYTDFDSHEQVDGAIFSAPGADGYIEITGQLEEARPVEVPNMRGRTIDPPGKWVMIVSGEMDRKMSAGDILTYMWALKAGSRVGLYRSSKIVIGEGTGPDGDEDVEPDEDPVIADGDAPGDLDDDFDEDSPVDGDPDADGDPDTDPDSDPDPDTDSDGDPDQDPDPQEEGEGDLNCPEGWYNLDDNPDDCEYQCILPEGQTEPEMEICDGHDNNCNGTVDEAAFCSPRDNASVICDFGCRYTCDNDFHDCNGACVSVNSINHCGASCDPCPGDNNGTASCDGVSCSFACNAQYHSCDDTCVSVNSVDHCGNSCDPCPNVANATPSCDGVNCGFQCVEQYHFCVDSCVSDNSTDHCGGSCSPCPEPANGSATCDGSTCGATCNSDYHACSDGQCYADSDGAHCGPSCMSCPDRPHASLNCQNDVCGITCDSAWYNLDNDPSDGCEFNLNPLAIYVSVMDAMSDDNTGCGIGPLGTGSENRPCFSIAAGLREAENTGRTSVLVAQGNYIETVTLKDGIDLLGGYNASTWERDILLSQTTITGTDSGQDRKTVIAVDILNETVLEGFTINGGANHSASGNSYAIHLSNSGGLHIRSNIIRAGSGGSGLSGSSGSPGLDGADGGIGSNAFDTGASSCTDSNPGGGGGARTCPGEDVSGGAGGGASCEPLANTQTSAEAGVDGSGPLSPGGGGTAGYDAQAESAGICLCSNICTGGDGTNGVDGGPGSGGAGCTNMLGMIESGLWRGDAGLHGGAGVHGSGGGGGGAGGGGDGSPLMGANDRLGGSGGGGGSGGCGGGQGFAASAGGGAFGIFITGGEAPTIEDNSIQLGSGGDGGDGGNGGDGGGRGFGAAGGQGGGNCLYEGGEGGDGGIGGAGGGGGGGCGGVSFGILSHSLSSSPDYCEVSLGNSFSSGFSGSGGTGGSSPGNAGTNGADGSVDNCVAM